jgi:hypothetical protein
MKFLLENQKKLAEDQKKQDIIYQANARAREQTKRGATSNASDKGDGVTGVTTAGTTDNGETRDPEETNKMLTMLSDAEEGKVETDTSTAAAASTASTASSSSPPTVEAPSLEDFEDDFDPEATLILISSFPFILVSHDSQARGQWESFILLLVFFQAVQAPYETVFDVSIVNGVFDIAMIVIFIVDFFHNFVCTFCNDNGDLVIDPKAIVKQYVTGPWFWIDLVSCLPFDLLVTSGPNSSTLKTVKLLRLFRMGKILKKVDNIVKAGTIRLVRLLVILLIVFHWTSCGWFAVGRVWLCRTRNYDLTFKENGTVPEFITEVGEDGIDKRFDLWNEDADMRGISGLVYEEHLCNNYIEHGIKTGFIEPVDMYLSALHQASTSLMGGGNAYTRPEQTYFAFVVILGAILQATVFGSVAVLLASVNEDAVRFQKKMLTINLRMAYLDIPEELQERVRLFYQKMWDTERSLTTDPNGFIDEVSKPLAADIKMQLYQDLLQSVDFFKHSREIVVEELVKCLKNQLYLEGDIIMRKGEVGLWMGFIGRGQIAILSPENGKVIRVMDKGEYLGEMALLYAITRTVDVRALSWVTMHILTADDMRRVKEEYPDDITYIEEELEASMIKKQYQHVASDEDEDVEDVEDGEGSDGNDEDDEGGDFDDADDNDEAGDAEESDGLGSENSDESYSNGGKKEDGDSHISRNHSLRSKTKLRKKASLKGGLRSSATSKRNVQHNSPHTSKKNLGSTKNIKHVGSTKNIKRDLKAIVRAIQDSKEIDKEEEVLKIQMKLQTMKANSPSSGKAHSKRRKDDE